MEYQIMSTAQPDLAELKATILSMVVERRHVSFVEVSELKNASGDLAIGLSDKNIWYWNGLSDLACDAIEQLRAEGEVHFIQTPAITYFIDGATLPMPLVKSGTAAERGYRKPHWLPVVLQPGPEEGRA